MWCLEVEPLEGNWIWMKPGEWILHDEIGAHVSG